MIRNERLDENSFSIFDWSIGFGNYNCQHCELDGCSCFMGANVPFKIACCHSFSHICEVWTQIDTSHFKMKRNILPTANCLLRFKFPAKTQTMLQNVTQAVNDIWLVSSPFSNIECLSAGTMLFAHHKWVTHTHTTAVIIHFRQQQICRHAFGTQIQWQLLLLLLQKKTSNN